MSNHIGLENILRAELTLLSKQILQDIHKKDIKELYRAVRKLHEKMAAIKILSEQLTDEEIIAIVNKEVTDNAPIETKKQEEEPPKPTDTIEEIMTPEETKIIETPKTERQKVDDIFKEVANISFVKKEKTPTTESQISSNNVKKNHVNETKSTSKPSTATSKDISIGLNDRIAFINNLFDGDAKAFNETIDKLNNCHSYENALQLIYNDIKPKYNNWDNKDQYEFRLLQLLELKFN